MVAPTPTAPRSAAWRTDEHDLVVRVGDVEERVVVQLHDEGNPVHVPAGRQAERAEGGGHGAALTGQRQLQEVQRVEVGRVLREAGRGRVLDPLVDREDGDVAGPAEPSVVEQRAEVAQHRRAAVAVGEDPVEVVGPRKHQVLRGEGLGRVAEEGVRILAEERVEIEARAHGASLPEGHRTSSGDRPSAPVQLVRGTADGRVWARRGSEDARPQHSAVPTPSVRSDPYAGRRRVRCRRAEAMNVLETRSGRPLRLRPDAPCGRRGPCRRGRPAPDQRLVPADAPELGQLLRPGRVPDRTRALRRVGLDLGLLLESDEPGAGRRRGRRPTRTISVTFSRPVSLQTATPAAVAGHRGHVGPVQRRPRCPTTSTPRSSPPPRRCSPSRAARRACAAPTGPPWPPRTR